VLDQHCSSFETAAARPPQGLIRNESSENNGVIVTPAKAGVQGNCTVEVRRAVYRLPLDSRFRGNDDRRSTSWKSSIHLGPASEGEEFSLMPSIMYLMLRRASAKAGARLEARALSMHPA
jgi:hypothetical protein